MKTSHTHHRGFTLIEVLIALAIIGIAMTAVIKAVSENTRATEYLQRKTMALWVGQEIMNETRLGLIELSGDGGELKGETEMLNQTWYWQVQKESTPNSHIKKIIVRVYPQPIETEESSLLTLESYV